MVFYELMGFRIPNFPHRNSGLWVLGLLHITNRFNHLGRHTAHYRVG